MDAHDSGARAEETRAGAPYRRRLALQVRDLLGLAVGLVLIARQFLLGLALARPASGPASGNPGAFEPLVEDPARRSDERVPLDILAIPGCSPTSMRPVCAELLPSPPVLRPPTRRQPFPAPPGR